MPPPPALPKLPAVWVYPAEDADPVRLQVRQVDMLEWEQASHRNRWAKSDDGPITMVWYLAYAAMRRTGKIPPGMKWDEFRTEMFGVTSEDSEPAAVPTEPGPDPG